MPTAKKTTTKPEKKIAPVKEALLQIPIYDIEGTVVKQMSVPPELSEEKVNKNLLAQYVRVYLHNQRQGTSSTQLRGEVTGSTRKIYKQKGTGKARHGSKKANLFKGGGVTFGPKPRDFHLKMNKKQKVKAMIYALQLRIKEKAIIGMSDAKIEPKTKLIAKFFNKIQINDKKVLMVLPTVENTNLLLAIRNLSKLEMKTITNINPYDVLTYRHIIFSENALDSFMKKYSNNE